MPKVIYFITEDWFFVSHFLPMARAANAAGFDIAVATRVGDRASKISSEGFRVIPLDVNRSSLGIPDAVRYLMQARRIIARERPDIVHCIAIKPILLAGLSAKIAGVNGLVLAPTGLGALWMDNRIAVRAVRGIARVVIGSWLRGSHTRYVFENREDPREFDLDPDSSDVVLVGGAGVDPQEFPVVHEPPAPPVKVAVVSRMIKPKGIAEAIEATRRARELGAPVELHLFGETDPSNPESLSDAALHELSASPAIHWHGRTADVARVWREHHVALLLSYREGMPRTLVEAAAAGRPIVTTDIVGCRELVRDGKEGILVAPGNVEAAAQALVRLAGDAALRARMGEAANARFHERFTERAVTSTIASLYRSLAAA